MEEIQGLVPLYAGITYERLTGRSLQWPCSSSQDSGTPFLYQDGFPGGKVTLAPVESSLSEEAVTTNHPYWLVTVQSLCHSGSFSLWSQGLCDLDRSGFAALNTRDADVLGIASGDRVTLISGKGSVTLPAQVTGRIPPGRIVVPYHNGELMVNVLTDRDNPLTRVSAQKG